MAVYDNLKMIDAHMPNRECLIIEARLVSNLPEFFQRGYFYSFYHCLKKNTQ